ncbi:MAG: MOSC N-terminal beta barrel domain-containing protein [Kofleriaceae bacterium]
MSFELGEIEAIYRYPVKSMRGEALDTVTLGWHGLDGDRRLAFRRLEDAGEFPWLTASKLPALVDFTPCRDGHGGELPSHVRTPEGDELPVFGAELAAEITRRLGAPVQMMQLKHGMFDEASISVLTSATAHEICRLAGTHPDVRRFRPNIVIRSRRGIPFEEDRWVGGVLGFGDTDAAVSVTMRDVRCVMVNLDPDGGSASPAMMKAVVRANQNMAGVYGVVTGIGRLAVGQTVVLRSVAALAKPDAAHVRPG